MNNGITRVKFHKLQFTTVSGVTGNATISLAPRTAQLGDLDEICTQFDLFKFTKLRYRIHPFDPTQTDGQVIAYVPDIDVQTTTAIQLSGSPIAAVQTPFCGVPSRWINVPKGQLKGMLDWYKCQADAGAAEFESQGLIMIATGLSDNVFWEVEGVCEFKNPVSDAVMLHRTMDRLERLGLMTRVPQDASSNDPAASIPDKGVGTPTGDRIVARTIPTIKGLKPRLAPSLG